MNWKTIILPAIILFVSIIIPQFHSILFWMNYVGTIGILWSISLEVIALWLWWRPEIKTRTIAFVATLLLLAGPVFHVSMPVYNSWNQTNKSELQIEREIGHLNKQIQQDMQTLNRFSENLRTFGKAEVVNLQENIDEMRERKEKLLEQKRNIEQEPLWQTIWIVAMQVIALIVLQIANVLTITWISARIRDYKKSKEISSENGKLNL